MDPHLQNNKRINYLTKLKPTYCCIISGIYFHGAHFSNYENWLINPIQIKTSAHVVWPIVGQEILNGDVGAKFQGIQICTCKFSRVRNHNNAGL